MSRIPFDLDLFLEWLDDNLDPIGGVVGNEQEYRCPFCGDSKFFVNVRSGAWICFHEKKCGRRSNSPIVLVAEVEGIPFAQAAQKLAEDGTPIVTSDAIEELLREFQIIRQQQAVNTIAPGSSLALPDTELAGLQWLTVTGAGIHALALQHLQSRNFDPDWFIANYRPAVGCYGRMRDRLILPHYRDGYMLYYQGRLLVEQEDAEYEIPKYLNPQSVACRVSRKDLIWNEQRLQADNEIVVVAEGIFKACAFERAGYPAVATYGSMVSGSQLQQLADSKVKYILVAPDRGDLEYETRLRTGLRTFYDLWLERVSKRLVMMGKQVLQLVPCSADYDEVVVEELWSAVEQAVVVGSQFAV